MEKEVKQNDDEDNEYPFIDEDEYVKNLIQEHDQDIDSLAELRKMIKKTKNDIQDYAGDLYTLKNSVSEANLQLKQQGKGVDDEILWDLDFKFQQNMPGYNKNRIFNDEEKKQKKNNNSIQESQTERKQRKK